MASIQRLKKELNYATSELMFGCYIADILNPTSTSDEILQIAQEVTNAYNNTIKQINQYRKLDKSEKQRTQQYFNALRTQYADTAKKISERLESYGKKQ